ncbi:unnamed protein product [Ectocarpus sp. 12 AP-2014]
MIEEGQQRAPTNAVFRFTTGPTNSAPSTLSAYNAACSTQQLPRQQRMQVDDHDEENFSSPPVKRKSSVMAGDHPPPPQLPPTHASLSAGASPSAAASGPAQASGGEEVSKHIKTPHRRRQQQPRQQVSMHVGEVMSVPLAGKSVPFRVIKRRSKGFNSVVFECREEQEEAMGDEADRPRRVVTVKVLSGGESGMGACLHEVETLAFLKVKRQEAGLTHERSRFAELASWFYRRSAVGGVDHVCLVFRGGGLSLREAMSARSPPIGTAQSGVTASNMPSSAPALLAWKPHEVVEVARGLLEGIAFLHSVGLVHADIKPDNVALYPPPPSSSSPPQNATTATSPTAAAQAPFDLRLIDLGNAVFASDTVPGVTAGTPSYLSPEASGGLAWGPPVDVWAVGCVLHEILTGGRVGAAAGFTIGKGGRGGGRSGSCGASGPSVGLLASAGLSAGSGPELTGVVGLVKRLLAEDVGVRPSAEEALRDVVFSARP